MSIVLPDSVYLIFEWCLAQLITPTWEHLTLLFFSDQTAAVFYQLSVQFWFQVIFSNWPYVLDFVHCVFLDLVTSYFKLSYWGWGWVLHSDHSYGFDYHQCVYSVLNSDLNLFNSSPWCPLECTPPDPWLCQPSHVWTPKPEPHPTPAQFRITWNGIIIYPTDQVEFIDWDCISHNHLAFPYIAIGFGGGKNFDHCKTTATKMGWN